MSERVMIFGLAVLIAEYNQKRQPEKDAERLTITSLSEATGIARSTLTRFNKGELARVDVEVLKTLGNFFDCPLSDLLRFDVVEDRGSESGSLPTTDS